MLKSYRWVGVVGWWVVAHEILVSAQGPLVFGFLGSGPGLDNSCEVLSHTKPRNKTRQLKNRSNSIQLKRQSLWFKIQGESE